MKEIIKNYIQNSGIFKVSPGFEIKDDTKLIESGILESFNIITLVLFLEENFSVKFESGDLNGSNFKDLNSIIAFVESKKNK
jgi:acyl carrier protein